MSRNLLHPLHALFGAHERAPGLPVCDHYAGIEARMKKALALQAEMAEAAGAEVGEVRTIADVVPQDGYPEAYPTSARASFDGDASVPIAAGSEELEVRVKVVFELA